MTNRFDRLTALNHDAQLAFPYVTLFDPNENTTLEMARELIEKGAPGLILGLPFSDPCADTLAQAAAAQRALAAGATTEGAFELVARIRALAPELPLALVTYLNPAVAFGFDAFTQKLADVGIDALLMPDLPSSMRLQVPDFDQAAQKAGLILGAFISPQMRGNTLNQLANKTHGLMVTCHPDGKQTLPFGRILTDDVALLCGKTYP